MLANWITLSRFPLLLLNVLILYLGSPVLRLAGVAVPGGRRVLCLSRASVIIHWMKHYWGRPAPPQPEGC